MNPLLLAVFSVVGLGGFVVGLLTSRRLWAAADTPTIPAGHAFPGRIEIFGNAVLPTGRLLTSPLTGSECAWWKFDVQRLDNAGKSKQWKTKGTVVSRLPLLVADDSGHVQVDPGHLPPARCRSEVVKQRALPSITPVMLEAVSGGIPLHALTTPPVPQRNLVSAVVHALAADAYGPDLNLAIAGGDWRVIEHRVELGDTLYVLGNARMLDSGELLLSRKHGAFYAYLGDERGLLRRLRWASGAAFTALREAPQRSRTPRATARSPFPTESSRHGSHFWRSQWCRPFESATGSSPPGNRCIRHGRSSMSPVPNGRVSYLRWSTSCEQPPRTNDTCSSISCALARHRSPRPETPRIPLVWPRRRRRTPKDSPPSMLCAHCRRAIRRSKRIRTMHTCYASLPMSRTA
jgi:hypothetical protein